MGVLQPKHFNFLTANIMMPPALAVGVGRAIDRVWSPERRDSEGGREGGRDGFLGRQSRHFTVLKKGRRREKEGGRKGGRERGHVCTYLDYR